MGQREQRGRVAGLVDDFEALVCEQPRQPLAQEHVVLSDQDAGWVGSHARIIDGGVPGDSSTRAKDWGLATTRSPVRAHIVLTHGDTVPDSR